MRRSALSILLLFAACTEPDFWAFSSRPIEGEGLTAVVVWTGDAPIDDVDSVWVVIDRVELDGVVLSDERIELDYLTLTNGVRALLASADVDSGVYERLRLHLAPTGHRAGDRPLALDRAVVDLTGPFDLRGRASVEFHLDLDLQRSITADGRLRPAIVLTDAATSGSIDGVAPAGATVTVTRDGVAVTSTRAGVDGTFRVGPLDHGVYRLESGARAIEAATDTAGHDLRLR